MSIKNFKHSKLVSSFPHLLSVILSLMEDNENTSSRKLAVRASIQNTVSKRFQDDAISVLEVSVSLVGIFFSCEQNLVNVFHNLLLARLLDNRISVVRSLLNILNVSICLCLYFLIIFLLSFSIISALLEEESVKHLSEQMISNKKYSGLASASTVLLQRVDDPRKDDSVRDIICETFQNLWFSGDRKRKIVMRTSKWKVLFSQLMEKFLLKI